MVQFVELAGKAGWEVEETFVDRCGGFSQLLFGTRG